MWIDANERKPNTARKVFVRGIRHENETAVAVASWHDFDDRWGNFIGIDNEITAVPIQVSHWMEINDLLHLPPQGYMDAVRKEKMRLLTNNTIVIRTSQGQSGTWYACFVYWNGTIASPVGSGSTEMLAIIDLCQQEQNSIDQHIESLVEEDDNG